MPAGVRHPPHRRVVVHAAVVAALLAVFWWMVAATGPGEGAAIGAGIPGFALLALGLPWSLPPLVDPYRFDGLPGAVWSLVYFGPAVVNVLLHAGLVAWRRRRR